MPIPGTTKQTRLQENIAAAAIELSGEELRNLTAAASRITVQGARYGENHQKLIDR